MVNTTSLQRKWPSAGIIGGAIFWYLAHDLGFYFSDYNCHHRGIVPSIELIMLVGCVFSGVISYRAWNSNQASTDKVRFSFLAGIGIAAASLFSLVILWQAIAAFIFTGCER